MDEREKIIETLRASGYGYFVTHEKANADEECIKWWLVQAEKEIAEERKGVGND